MKNIQVFLVMACILFIMGFECQLIKTTSDGTTSGGTGTGTGTGTTTGDTIRLVFAGDTILARRVKDVVISNGSGSYQYPFQYVGDFLRNADVAFLNLESIISDAGTPADSTAVSQGTAFRADPAAVNGLTYAGINVVSVANDHAFDYGREAFDDCLQRLKNAGITYIGGGTFNESYTAQYFLVKGTIIAFLAFTNLTNEGTENSVRAQQDDSTQGLSAQTGVAWFYPKYVGPAINQAKKLANVVIVSLHMGTENQTLPNADQDKFAHYCIDQGANLVVGHHPHVIQPVMVYMNDYIAHSLGNFISDQDGDYAKKGMILEVVVSNKKIAQVNRKYVQINGSYQPVIQ